jgi:4-hydroxythreonine-4-phosphate dehydrogenase
VGTTAPLAVSLGDPAGVGPELIAEAWTRRGEESLSPFVVAGGARLLAAAAKARGLILPVQRVGSLAEAASVFFQALPVLGELDGDYRPGEPAREGADLALASLTEATRLATIGEASGVVTGPIAKARLAEVGFDHPGQTEFVAAACGVAADDAVMMLAGPSLRTVPLTVHLALAEVPAKLTTELIRRRCAIVATALRSDFGLENPRLALAALNPHAGEDGRFGDEERRIIAPAPAASPAPCSVPAPA